MSYKPLLLASIFFLVRHSAPWPRTFVAYGKNHPVIDLSAPKHYRDVLEKVNEVIILDPAHKRLKIDTAVFNFDTVTYPIDNLMIFDKGYGTIKHSSIILDRQSQWNGMYKLIIQYPATDSLVTYFLKPGVLQADSISAKIVD